MKKEGASELGVFAAVLGVLSIVLPIANFPFGVFFGSIVGIVLGIIALIMGVKAKKVDNSCWAKTAIVTGIIGIVVSVLLLFWAVALLAALGSKIDELGQQGLFDQLAQAQSAAGVAE